MTGKRENFSPDRNDSERIPRAELQRKSNEIRLNQTFEIFVRRTCLRRRSGVSRDPSTALHSAQDDLKYGGSEWPMPVGEVGDLAVVNEREQRADGECAVDPSVPAFFGADGQPYEEEQEEVERFQGVCGLWTPSPAVFGAIAPKMG